MRFLIEKSVLSDDQELDYQSLSKEKKRKYVDNYLKTHPNNKNIQYFTDIARESILEKGFDDSENPFLTYMSNIKIPVKRDVAKIVKYFLDREDILPSSRWLYKNELYQGDEDTVIFKVKAFAYASNKSYQQNADRQITPETLMDKSGKILPIDKMMTLLNSIKVTQANQQTIQNSLERNLKGKDFTNKHNIKIAKNWLKELIQPSKEFRDDMLTQIDDLPMSDILKIPVSNSTTKATAVGLINFLKGKTKLVNYKSKKKLNGLDYNAIAAKTKKTAEQVKQIVDKVINPPSDASDLAYEILVQLGQGKVAAQEAVDKIISENPNAKTEDIISACFNNAEVSLTDNQSDKDIKSKISSF